MVHFFSSKHPTKSGDRRNCGSLPQHLQENSVNVDTEVAPRVGLQMVPHPALPDSALPQGAGVRGLTRRGIPHYPLTVAVDAGAGGQG